MAESAVTSNYVKAHSIAASRVDEEIASLLRAVDACRASAARSGSIYSAAQDTASCYLIDDLRRAIQALKKSAEAHRQTIIALLRAPCPACMAGQRVHCPHCGSCPGKGRGPSCEDLICESIGSSVTRVG